MSFNYTAWDLENITRPYENDAGFLLSNQEKSLIGLTFAHEAKTGITDFLGRKAQESFESLFGKEEMITPKKAKSFYGVEITEEKSKSYVENKARLSVLNREFEKKFTEAAGDIPAWNMAKTFVGAAGAAIVDPVSLVATVGIGALGLKALSKAPRVAKAIASGNLLQRYAKTSLTIGSIDAAVDVGLEEVRSVGQRGELLSPGEVAIQAVLSAATSGLLTTGFATKLGQGFFEPEDLFVAKPKFTEIPSSTELSPFVKPTDLVKAPSTELSPFVKSTDLAKFNPRFMAEFLVSGRYSGKEIPTEVLEKLRSFGFSEQNAKEVKEFFDYFVELGLYNTDYLDGLLSMDVVSYLRADFLERKMKETIGDYISKKQNIRPLKKGRLSKLNQFKKNIEIEAEDFKFKKQEDAGEYFKNPMSFYNIDNPKNLELKLSKQVDLFKKGKEEIWGLK